MADPTLQDVLSAVIGVGAEVGRVRADVTQIQGTVTQMQGTVTQMQGTVTQMQGTVTQIQGTVTQMQGTVTRMQGDITQLQSDMKHVQSDVKQFRAELTQLRVDVMDRIDRLQGTLTLQKDDLVVNYGAADRAEKIARAAQEETRALGDMVTPMIRQIRRLQEDVRHLRGEP